MLCTCALSLSKGPTTLPKIREYATLDATGLADLIRRKEVTAAEVVETAIAHLERAEPHLCGMAERVLEQAREEALRPSGSPFGGVPFLLKDNLHVAAGIPYHNGSRIWRGWIPPRDSELVRRFKAAGLIVLGTTKVPELSLTPVTEPKRLGRVNNPWSLDPKLNRAEILYDRPHGSRWRRNVAAARGLESLDVGDHRQEGCSCVKELCNVVHAPAIATPCLKRSGFSGDIS